MKLRWSEDALHDLEAIALRAPVQAGQVFDAVEELGTSPFPRIHRRVEGGYSGEERGLIIGPHMVLYEIEDDAILVLRIVDCRRRSTPW